MQDPGIKAKAPVGAGASKLAEMGNICTQIIAQPDPRTPEEREFDEWADDWEQTINSVRP